MADWKLIADWTDWRRYAPVAGSVVTHGAVAVLLAALMTGSIRAPGPAPPPLPKKNLEITLISETPPPVRQPARPQPRAPQAAEPKGDTIPVRPPVKDPRKTQKETAIRPDADSVYVPPSILAESNIPPGLQGAVAADPCKPKYGVKPKDCVSGWASRLGPLDTVSPRSEEDLKRFYAQFMVTCPYKVGCGPDQRKMIQLNGAQSVVGTAMASGAAGMGGINDLVGRLGFDPDHRDPGFGD